MKFSVICLIFILFIISGCNTGSEPVISEYSNSGCLTAEDDASSTDYDAINAPCTGPEVIETIVDNGTLYIIHKNSIQNCCLDEIKVTLEVDESILKVKEETVESAPCDCACCYNVKSTIIGLSTGVYVLKYCSRQCFEKYIVVL